MIVNISEAKINLSKLIDLVYQGQKVVITKNNLPMVDLVIHKSAGKRKLGLLLDKINIPEDFDNENIDINDMFYGNYECS